MDYNKYSLKNLEEWVFDAVSQDEVSPKEIYDTIYKAVTEQYYYFKHNAGRCYDLMLLLNGNGNYVVEDSEKTVPKDRHSPFYYEYDRNDPERPNPFKKD
jgi:hypothetical protein